jgi:hypothetical protein
MTATARKGRWLGVTLGALLALAVPAWATPAHHTIDKVVKTATGADVHVLMHSVSGYNSYSVGVTLSGGRTAAQQHAKSGTTQSTGEVILNVPYNATQKTGTQLRVISSWPRPGGHGGSHYWGDNSDSLITLP